MIIASGVVVGAIVAATKSEVSSKGEYGVSTSEEDEQLDHSQQDQMRLHSTGVMSLAFTRESSPLDPEVQ